MTPESVETLCSFQVAENEPHEPGIHFLKSPTLKVVFSRFGAEDF